MAFRPSWALAYRDRRDLRPGEAVYAIVSRTSSDVALSSGTLVSTDAGGGPYPLATTATSAFDSRAAVVVDAQGNLVGIGPVPTIPAAPLSPSIVPDLAAVDLGPAAVRVAAADRGRNPEIILPLRVTDRDDGQDELIFGLAPELVDPRPQVFSADRAGPDLSRLGRGCAAARGPGCAPVLLLAEQVRVTDSVMTVDPNSRGDPCREKS